MMKKHRQRAHFFWIWIWTCSLICLFMNWWLLSVYAFIWCVCLWVCVCDLNSNIKCAYLVFWVRVLSAFPRTPRTCLIRVSMLSQPIVIGACVYEHNHQIVRASAGCLHTHSYSYFHYSCFVAAFGGYRAQWSCIRYVLEILSMDRLNENRKEKCTNVMNNLNIRKRNQRKGSTEYNVWASQQMRTREAKWFDFRFKYARTPCAEWKSFSFHFSVALKFSSGLVIVLATLLLLLLCFFWIAEFVVARAFLCVSFARCLLRFSVFILLFLIYSFVSFHLLPALFRSNSFRMFHILISCPWWIRLSQFRFLRHSICNFCFIFDFRTFFKNK